MRWRCAGAPPLELDFVALAVRGVIIAYVGLCAYGTRFREFVHRTPRSPEGAERAEPSSTEPAQRPPGQSHPASQSHCTIADRERALSTV